jgi:hypothetical protein
MVRELDDPDLTCAAETADSQPTRFEPHGVLGVHSVVAIVVLDDLVKTVQFRGRGPGDESHGLRLTHERTGERRDDQPRRRGARFGVVGVSEPENVAREFYDRVLEATSGPDEGDAALPGMANRGEGAAHASIGAGRGDPDAVVPPEPRSWLVADLLGRHPLEAEPHMVQRGVGEAMGRVLGIKVAHNTDQRVHGH